jgi:glyoxylase-like metal-dependent hydrolase (beta-lactamase superfamily II)
VRNAAGAVALVGPVFVALAAIVVSQRPSAAAYAISAAVVLAVLASDAALLRTRRRGLVVAALALDAVVVLFLTTYCASPLPRPSPMEGALPPASPPPGMAAYKVPTGVIHHTAAFGYRGGSFLDRRDFAMTAALLTHPRGDLLVDSGLSRSIATQLRLMPRSFGMLSNYEVRASAAEQLDAAHYDRKRLRGILLTHAHWDHASGVADFPDLPILVAASEKRYIDERGKFTEIARSVPASRYQTYEFEGGPYLGFPASHDVYGDGSIVVVPTPGHTPGSVIVFVAVPDGSRYAFVGDLVWQLEGISEREERPWFVRRQADLHPEGTRENLLRMCAIATRYPEVTVVPAHDSRGFAKLPPLDHTFGN